MYGLGFSFYGNDGLLRFSPICRLLTHIWPGDAEIDGLQGRGRAAASAALLLLLLCGDVRSFSCPH